MDVFHISLSPLLNIGSDLREAVEYHYKEVIILNYVFYLKYSKAFKNQKKEEKKSKRLKFSFLIERYLGKFHVSLL